MNCEPCRLLLVDYLDDELVRSEREKVAAHLQACPACRELALNMEQSLAVFRASAAVEPPPLENGATEIPLETARTSAQGTRGLPWLALAAAALLLLGAGIYFRLHSAPPATAPWSSGVELTRSAPTSAAPSQSFVFHGRGMTRKNRLDLKL